MVFQLTQKEEQESHPGIQALFNKSQSNLPSLIVYGSLLLSHTPAKLGDTVPKFAFLSSCLDDTVPPLSEDHPHLPWKAHVPGDTSGLLVTLWLPLPVIDGLPLHFCLDKPFKVMSATTIYYTVFNTDLSSSINL